MKCYICDKETDKVIDPCDECMEVIYDTLDSYGDDDEEDE